MKLSTSLFVIDLFLWSVFCFAQVPREITYQGYLTNNSGQPITNNLQFTFIIYDAPSGGNTLWEEIQNPVAVIEGVFKVILGSNEPLNLTFDEQYWLGIKVGNDPELTPRITLTGVGYSLYSLKADSVNHLAEGSVATTQIVDGAVTQAKLAAGTSLPPGGMAGGDLTGTYPNPVVTGIQNRPVALTSPVSQQVLKWNGSSWVPADDEIGTEVWSTSGNNIYNSNSGNVGIGTDTPGIWRLNVQGADQSITWGGDHTQAKYIRLGDLQICWGDTAVASATSGNVDITFPVPFINTSYSMSVMAVDGGWSFVTALGGNKDRFYWHNLTMVSHDGHYQSGRVSWIAIGPWR